MRSFVLFFAYTVVNLSLSLIVSGVPRMMVRIMSKFSRVDLRLLRMFIYGSYVSEHEL